MNTLRNYICRWFVSKTYEIVHRYIILEIIVWGGQIHVVSCVVVKLFF